MLEHLLKLLGFHVCGPYTPWETRKANFFRIPVNLEERIALGDDAKIEYTRRWQERVCVECGKMQQRDLDA